RARHRGARARGVDVRGRRHGLRPGAPGRIQDAAVGGVRRRAAKDGVRQTAQARAAGPVLGRAIQQDRLAVQTRRLGSSGIEVSALSLGSWRTYERLPAQTGIAIMRAAHDEGITFFDDARYNDETGAAPIPTGYSEVVFGKLFRGSGLRRDEVVVANKLWWEF